MRIETFSDFAIWNEALAELPVPCRDVYFTPEYHHLHTANGDGEAYCAAVSEDRSRLLVPGLRVPITFGPGALRRKALWDVQTCNGYGGPLVSPDVTPDFLKRAWEAWRRDSAAHGVVAAFLRLHPLLNNSAWLPADARVIEDRKTVFVDLQQGAQTAWARASSRHRNMVNKGRRENVQIIWDDPNGWEAFEKLYGEAMERLNAPPALRFSPAYFAALRNLPCAELACVRRRGELAAAAVFMFGPRWGHYHLSARQPDAGNHLTNCLLQDAFERAAKYGLEGIHLGGGRSAAPGDSLLMFKRNLGGQLIDFKVALVIVDMDVYRQLCLAWAEETGRQPQWLLGYRQPRPALPNKS